MQRMPHSACRHCGSLHTVSNGSSHGHHQWSCRECGRSFRATTGTPVAGLKTPVEEIARTLLVVLRRGSLRAAEEITGHKYETIGAWLRRAGTHAAALTEVLVHELHLTAGEVDEFWSFVRKKGPLRSRR
ncbi:MAG: IS1 family transposase [Chloroflexi bacterium]|nr:IS1 family transposase [Chloroflexota bacterium]